MCVSVFVCLCELDPVIILYLFASVLALYLTPRVLFTCPPYLLVTCPRLFPSLAPCTCPHLPFITLHLSRYLPLIIAVLARQLSPYLCASTQPSVNQPIAQQGKDNGSFSAAAFGSPILFFG